MIELTESRTNLWTPHSRVECYITDSEGTIRLYGGIFIRELQICVRKDHALEGWYVSDMFSKFLKRINSLM
jgi:hypothetical protein